MLVRAVAVAVGTEGVAKLVTRFLQEEAELGNRKQRIKDLENRIKVSLANGARSPGY